MPEIERAFPTSENSYRNSQDGMSLRDYFAAKAMQSLIADHFRERMDISGTDIVVATWAYAMADRMLAEREK